MMDHIKTMLFWKTILQNVMSLPVSGWSDNLMVGWLVGSL